jgi:hypothetical protein
MPPNAAEAIGLESTNERIPGRWKLHGIWKLLRFQPGIPSAASKAERLIDSIAVDPEQLGTRRRCLRDQRLQIGRCSVDETNLDHDDAVCASEDRRLAPETSGLTHVRVR